LIQEPKLPVLWLLWAREIEVWQEEEEEAEDWMELSQAIQGTKE
jgi:uncharacterized protein (DUF2384 family)